MRPNIRESEIESVFLIANGKDKKAKDFNISSEENYSHMDTFCLKFDKEDKEDIEEWRKSLSKIRVETDEGFFFDFNNIIPGACYEKDDFYSEIVYVSTI